MYKVLTPNIKPLYKFLWAYGNPPGSFGCYRVQWVKIPGNLPGIPECGRGKTCSLLWDLLSLLKPRENTLETPLETSFEVKPLVIVEHFYYIAGSMGPANPSLSTLLRYGRSPRTVNCEFGK